MWAERVQKKPRSLYYCKFRSVTKVIFVILGPRKNYAVCAAKRQSNCKINGLKKITDRLLKVGDNVLAILLLLETGKGHGRTRNELD